MFAPQMRQIRAVTMHRRINHAVIDTARFAGHSQLNGKQRAICILSAEQPKCQMVTVSHTQRRLSREKMCRFRPFGIVEFCAEFLAAHRITLISTTKDSIVWLHKLSSFPTARPNMRALRTKVDARRTKDARSEKVSNEESSAKSWEPNEKIGSAKNHGDHERRTTQ